jgi:LCP family protein required for cell wall assembly
MARADKPYRVYKGGRAKGGVPTLTRRPRPKPARPAQDGRPPERYRGPGPVRRERRFGPGRIVFLTVILLILLLIGWTVAGYLAVRSGVQKANSRLSPAAKGQLAPQDGLLISTPSMILVIGSDHSTHPTRRGNRLADTIMVIRTDPEHHSMSYLSIPRDLEVDVPGYGHEKINSSLPLGGPSLTIRTVREAFGFDVNHVILLDMTNFKDVIDALGGVEIDVPEKILSNKFDCPYKAPRCAEWDGWRFEKGKQTMDGRRALVYSRVRTNQLDASDNDVTRGGRQQAVADAVGDKIASFGTFLKLPFVGDSLAAPLVTDLTAAEFLRLGWVRFRADSSRSIHCRLGGEPASFGGESVLLGSEDNVEVVAMFLRRSAPQPPPKGALYDGGCTRRPG